MARFATVNESEFSNILKDMNSPNTHRVTNVAWSVFQNYLKEKCIDIDPAVVLKEVLNNILKVFYFEVRKNDGGLYKRNSFNAIRFGLERKFNEERQFSITADSEFSESNTAFKAQCVQLKKKGLSKVDHKPPITPEDMRKLYESDVFSLSTPATLQKKVFFEVLFFFCRRGRENLRNLTKSSFLVKTDGNGVEYIQSSEDELTKNHRENDENQDGGVMYATGTITCPVLSFKTYVAKLNPKVDALFQRPKTSPLNNELWYDAQVLGIKSLESLMKKISVDANLSTIYTNHSIRATSISVLDSSGFEARHIMALSGHRSEQSIRSYSRTDLGTKRKMSSNLANFVPSKEFVPNFNFGIDLCDDLRQVDLTSKVTEEGTDEKKLVFDTCTDMVFSNCTFNL